MRRAFHSVLCRSIAMVALLLVLGSAYFFFIRPAQLHWGATSEEVARSMPEDGVVAHPAFDATRAITITGTPQQIWPWLVQMGFGRAGFYGYDLIENAGSGTGNRSARAILPAFQHPQTGDRLPISVAATLKFGTIETNSTVVWLSQDVPCDGVYIWQLVPIDEQHTRLISRIRWSYAPGLFFKALGVFTEFADHVAVRKILYGIRDRVEGRDPESLTLEALEIAAWLLALAELCAAMIAIAFVRRWKVAWLFALAAGAVLLFTLYSNQPLWLSAPLPWLYLGLMILYWRKRAANLISHSQPDLKLVVD